jgi:hypothetical protein
MASDQRFAAVGAMYLARLVDVKTGEALGRLGDRCYLRAQRSGAVG